MVLFKNLNCNHVELSAFYHSQSNSEPGTGKNIEHLVTQMETRHGIKAFDLLRDAALHRTVIMFCLSQVPGAAPRRCSRQRTDEGYILTQYIRLRILPEPSP
ncbi:hypothetical protein AVEN_14176-1 [Araneus ventricosus]|uniref:Uncharacterized protein n=1 Tax=Araneus ventricosus TaxID=182803 RepID=A0A4Y1ZP84_ARAVE|nr:hypothetical protein AVEN_14176-1 [Araneus ventricosus]